ncbi:type II toxin-antitoxin system RelE/ParE family toxin [Rhizobium sp. P32RR-XVIII]|uniref:type II toxin-antitoxin system RelE/ParE family toxin n=1 Tax=Rhizobium sp. P32RR-XVIII TaxID=2726738 RepID=UPI0014564BC9|nr:type II toxin-antitoxin system RelE/ParE family toxin [Rhizobium sp. P32RR-XVIII]NLS04473.1 type II toxin-antitoxin system RelE/ParE family toxin [Rhizobium sp. P32RR-XVIII]
MKLVIKPAARRDILSQAAYLAENGGAELGLRFVASVEESFRRLGEYPNAGAPRAFANPSLAGLRSWPIPDFEDVRAYYLVNDHYILILRVLYGRRDLPHALAEI